jgi:hypothetical protein
MVIFNSYVKLPEGISFLTQKKYKDCTLLCWTAVEQGHRGEFGYFINQQSPTKNVT